MNWQVLIEGAVWKEQAGLPLKDMMGPAVDGSLALGWIQDMGKFDRFSC